MKWIIAYLVCPLLGLYIIWRKQGRFLDEVQIFPAFLCGPLTLLIAIFVSARHLTSRKKAGLE